MSRLSMIHKVHGKHSENQISSVQVENVWRFPNLVLYLPMGGLYFVHLLIPSSLVSASTLKKLITNIFF
jgi:hypothetical protein